MKKINLVFGSLLIGVVFLSGCLGMDPEALAFANPLVKQFMSEYPNAQITVTHFTSEQTEQVLENISSECANPYMTAKDLYRITINEPDSGLKVIAWVDWENKRLECAVKYGIGENKTISKPGKPIETCKSHAEFKCYGEHVYWFDSCGHKQEKKEYCGYGCRENKCMVCEDYRYSTCPDQCEKRCVPSVCNGDICTTDCEGPGSCFTPEKECRDESYPCTIEDIPCCAGLKEVPYGGYEPSTGQCIAATCGHVCRPCGNGICDENEDGCTCPEDCGTVCIDSDEGKNYHEWGTATKGGQSLSDYCNEDGTLTEKYCENNEIKAVTVECPAGTECLEGACVETGSEYRLIPYDSRQTSPSIYGNKVAYMDYRNDVHGDIYLYDISEGKEKPVFEGEGFQYDPIIYGKYVVYGEREGNGLYIYNIDTEETETIVSEGQTEHDSSDEYVVWVDMNTGKILYIYDISEEITREIRDNTGDSHNKIYNPSTDGIYVAWQENDMNVSLYNIATDEAIQISDSPAAEYGSTDISGNRVIWVQGEFGSQDIILYDIASGERRALGLDDFGRIFYPKINGGMIAWYGCRSDKYRDHYSEEYFSVTYSCIDSDVFVYDLEKGELHLVEPNNNDQKNVDVYGNHVVWQEWNERQNTIPKIYMKNL